MMMADFEDRVVLVTGAASGIGLAAAEGFAQRGATVVAFDLNGPVRPVEAGGGRVEFRVMDVTDEQSVARSIDDLVREFGKLDVAFNNAGILLPTLEAEWDVESFQRCMDVNVTGVMRCMKHEIRVMTEHGGGSIVNTSSIAGIVGLGGTAAYAASKHAVIGLTKSAALSQAAHGIRVNAVCPGPTDTPMTALSRARRGSGKAVGGVPLGRSAAPDEIAAAAIWLSSPAASYVTGHALVVDGGFTAG